ncbi:hypothetical protein DYBT9275_03247 [Dyadobacter sp. CECT 9275]|uniref:Uncharacterized protein n=1 Tax=Dyadobacter helix TaxID=2822344 RepID=A0A916JCY6_9BACT|nr:hypothetical protein DYBT9275_03247 [Dyadobacter sp. CECT 9275]
MPPLMKLSIVFLIRLVFLKNLFTGTRTFKDKIVTK